MGPHFDPLRMFVMSNPGCWRESYSCTSWVLKVFLVKHFFFGSQLVTCNALFLIFHKYPRVQQFLARISHLEILYDCFRNFSFHNLFLLWVVATVMANSPKSNLELFLDKLIMYHENKVTHTSSRWILLISENLDSGQTH